VTGTRTRSAEQLRRRGIRLEWATNVWNSLEVGVTLALGVAAHSLALIAFGLDSIAELFASTVVLGNLHDRRHDPGDRRVHRSLRRLAVAFWVLGAFLVAAGVRGLVLGTRPGSSPLGMAWLASAALVMFVLAVMKRATGRELGSEPLQAEAALTFLDGCLSSGILLALVLNATLGWWWTDAGAALVVAGFAVAEGVRHWRESAPHADDHACPAGGTA